MTPLFVRQREPAYHLVRYEENRYRDVLGISMDIRRLCTLRIVPLVVTVAKVVLGFCVDGGPTDSGSCCLDC
jgi:hypothetical protein